MGFGFRPDYAPIPTCQSTANLTILSSGIAITVGRGVGNSGGRAARDAGRPPVQIPEQQVHGAALRTAHGTFWSLGGWPSLPRANRAEGAPSFAAFCDGLVAA